MKSRNYPSDKVTFIQSGHISDADWESIHAYIRTRSKPELTKDVAKSAKKGKSINKQTSDKGN